MNSYELSRNWFDWAFDNASKIRPIHTALFFFIIEHNNRLGWKSEFGLPRQMAMDAIGVKNNRTFTSAFTDLEDWGFIKVLERSKNQYSANIITLNGCVKNTPATTKALDKALQKHSQKHSTGIAPIDKPINKETYKHSYSKNEFFEDWNRLRSELLKKPSNLNKLARNEEPTFNELKQEYTREQFQNGLEALFRQEIVNFDSMHLRPKHLLENFETYQTAYEAKTTGLYGRKPKENKL